MCPKTRSIHSWRRPDTWGDSKAARCRSRGEVRVNECVDEMTVRLRVRVRVRVRTILCVRVRLVRDEARVRIRIAFKL